MPAPSALLQPVDWTSTQSAAFSYAEQIRAFGRLPAQRILPAPWWLLIDQTDADRPWYGPLGATPQHCHFVDLFELDSHGTTALVNREIGNIPAASFVALGLWDIVPQMAAHLRVHHLGSAFHSCSVLAEHVFEASFRLNIPKRFAANDARLPNCSEIRCGTLFRLDPSSTKSFRRYFCLPSPVTLTEPVVIELGADCYLIYAEVNDTQESGRGIITDSLFRPPARKEIDRWIRSHSHPKRKEVVQK